MTEVTYRALRGINNQQDHYAIGFDELLEATNVDVDNVGGVRRRVGTTQRAAAANAHSLFSDGDVALYRADTSLYRLNDDYTGTAIKTGLASGRRMAYAVLPTGRIFLSDGSFAGSTNGSQVSNWGIAPPAAQPQAMASGGALPQGLYQFAVTFLRKDGQESGTGRAGALSTSGGIYFTSIPVSSDPDVTQKALYLSRPDGDELYLAMILTNGTTEANFRGSPDDLGRRLTTQFKGPPRPGTVLGHYNGRALLADGPFLQYSEVWLPELFDPNGFIGFPSGVRLLAPVNAGVFVGTATEIVFLAGADIAQAEYVTRAQCAAVRESVTYVNGSQVGDGFSGVCALMCTDRGVMLGTEDGQLVALTERRYQLDSTMALAAAGLRSQAGNERYIAILR